jgi:hypothetical protein
LRHHLVTAERVIGSGRASGTGSRHPCLIQRDGRGLR